jgi:hypothetical protein
MKVTASFTDIGLESGTAVSQDGTEQACMGVAIGDYLHNGRPSIYVSNFENEYNTLYRNNGAWQFDDVSYKSGVGLPSMPLVKWGDAFLDADNDGWLDLIAVTGHVYPQVASLERVTKSHPYFISTSVMELSAMPANRLDQL